ncbi:MAG: hypothetical protein AAF558_01355 [Verrucomicrobiota bacterium]
MKVLIINQFGPGDASPTARLAKEMVEYFQSLGWQAEIACKLGNYRTRYRGMGRIFVEIWALCLIFFRGFQARGISQIIVFSSPPLVLLVGVVLGKLKNVPVNHWILDAYPDVAEALGVLRSRIIIRILRQMMKWGYRQARINVAVDSSMRIRMQEEYRIESRVISPWPPALSTEDHSFWWQGVSQDHHVWLYSGNLGQAHEWEVLLKVQCILEERGLPISLVFQGGGVGYEQARLEVEHMGLKHVYFHDYLDEEKLVPSLTQSLLSVVTQRKSVKGMLWPSKLALIQCLDREYLWIGPRLLVDDMNRYEKCHQYDPEDVMQIADWIVSRTEHKSIAEVDRSQVKDAIEYARAVGLQSWKEVLTPS